MQNNTLDLALSPIQPNKQGKKIEKWAWTKFEKEGVSNIGGLQKIEEIRTNLPTML